MIKTKRKLKYPGQLACLIIVSALFQIVSTNQSIVDSIIKIGIIGVFTLITFKGQDFANISVFFLFYIFMFVMSNIATILVNQVGLISHGIEIFSVFLLFFLFYEKPNGLRSVSKDDIEQFYRIYAYFMVFACVYNMIVNFDSVANILSLSIYSKSSAHSFFDNKNTYGIYLLFGSLACMMLKTYTNEKKWAYIALLIIFNELMSMCRTAVLLSAIIFAISFIINKKHLVRNMVLVLIGIVVVLALVETIPVLNRYFLGNVFGNVDSMERREIYIKNMAPLIRDKYLFVGYGNEKSTNLAAIHTGNRYFHNTYLYLLINGGIFKFSLFLAVILKIIKACLATIRRSTVLGVACFVCVICYLVYAYIECFTLFDTPVISMLATVFVVSMPLMIRKSLQH